MQSILSSLRMNFLTLTLACVFLGTTVSYRLVGHLQIVDIVLVLIGALLAHACVNLLNEYQDYRSGLDVITVKTPFSGGSGALPAHPEAAGATLTAAVITFSATAVIGVYFLLSHGLWLLPVGILGLLTIVFYTNWITRHALLCLVAPGFGFGPLMVMGTGFVLTNHYTWQAFIASLTPFFLVSELLLINQFPDVEADRQVGRQHYPILIGRRRSALIGGAFLLLAYAPIAGGVLTGFFPKMAALGLIPLLFAVPLAWNMWRKSESPNSIVSYLGFNVAVIMATIILFAAGWLFKY